MNAGHQTGASILRGCRYKTAKRIQLVADQIAAAAIGQMANKPVLIGSRRSQGENPELVDAISASIFTNPKTVIKRPRPNGMHKRPANH